MAEFCRALDAQSLMAASAANVDRLGFDRLSDSMPAACDPVLRSFLRDSAEALACSSMEMASGAGHDAAFMSLIAPSAMVFIPCKGGRSHTPEEWTSIDQLGIGTEVMLDAVLRFDGG